MQPCNMCINALQTTWSWYFCVHVGRGSDRDNSCVTVAVDDGDEADVDDEGEGDGSVDGDDESEGDDDDYDEGDAGDVKGDSEED